MNNKTKSQLPTIALMLLAGKRSEEIAAATGLSYSTIRVLRKRAAAGEPLIRKPVRKHRFSKKVRDHIPAIQEMAAAGIRPAVIHRATAVSLPTIRKILSCN